LSKGADGLFYSSEAFASINVDNMKDTPVLSVKWWCDKKETGPVAEPSCALMTKFSLQAFPGSTQRQKRARTQYIKSIIQTHLFEHSDATDPFVKRALEYWTKAFGESFSEQEVSPVEKKDEHKDKRTKLQHGKSVIPSKQTPSIEHPSDEQNHAFGACIEAFKQSKRLYTDSELERVRQAMIEARWRLPPPLTTETLAEAQYEAIYKGSRDPFLTYTWLKHIQTQRGGEVRFEGSERKMCKAILRQLGRKRTSCKVIRRRPRKKRVSRKMILRCRGGNTSLDRGVPQYFQASRAFLVSQLVTVGGDSTIKGSKG